MQQKEVSESSPISYVDSTTFNAGVQMRAFLVPLILAVTALTAAGQSPQPTQANLLDSALAQVGMTSREIRFDQDEMATWGGDHWRLKYFTLFHRNPLKLPKYGGLNLNEYSDNVTNITRLVASAGRTIDYPVFRGLIGDPLERYLDFPDTIPKPSITRSKNILVGKKYNALKDKIDLFYALADDDDFAFRKGIKPIDKRKYRQRLFDCFVNENEEYHDLIYELYDKTDFNRLIAGAQDIAEAVQRTADSIEHFSFPDRRLEFETRKGLIVVGSSGDDVYEYLEPPFLIIDGGGDDIYRFSGYPDKYPLSVIIDAAGNDRYISSDTARPGICGAVIGMSVLIDKSGDDYYESVNVAQGAAFFGVAVLLDYSGDDVYVSRSMSQGAGVFGIGILADSSGNDSLFCMSMSQGFGYTKGCGLLINCDGNDKYVADDNNIVNPSSQTPQHNSSLAQGVGFGKRGDYVDGHSWAGGVGILCDRRGDDSYSAGLFAQGCAYWFAVGMLLDGEGDDTYNGVWYVQGSGAHFGVGYLDDFEGNDTYTASHNMAMGAGHDFTIGYLNERTGNDKYTAPNLSLGGGNANGIGIFHDHAGDDVYETNGGVTLGRANVSTKGPRQYLNVFGIFIDGGGRDTYTEHYANNGVRWIGPKSNRDDTSDYEIGVGIDW